MALRIFGPKRDEVLYYTLYTIKLKICTQRFYYSSSKFSKFIQGKSPVLQQLATVSLIKEKSKMCPKLIELLSWNGPTVHVCCFMLARASTKTFVSRVQKTAKKSSLVEKFVSRVTRQPRYHRIGVSWTQFPMPKLYAHSRFMKCCLSQNGTRRISGSVISALSRIRRQFKSVTPGASCIIKMNGDT